MIIQLTLFLTKFLNQFFLRFIYSFNFSSLLAFMLFRHFLKRILFFFHWKYPLYIKLDISVETDFFSLFFIALIENNDNKLPKKSLHVHFYCTKNPRPKQARKIWSTSIWPPATRQNTHMNQSQFWPCRLSNRFQKYLTLWALESLYPICQGKIMDSVQAKKNAHFLAANFHHR